MVKKALISPLNLDSIYRFNLLEPQFLMVKIRWTKNVSQVWRLNDAKSMMWIQPFHFFGNWQFHHEIRKNDGLIQIHAVFVAQIIILHASWRVHSSAPGLICRRQHGGIATFTHLQPGHHCAIGWKSCLQLWWNMPLFHEVIVIDGSFM